MSHRARDCESGDGWWKGSNDWLGQRLRLQRPMVRNAPMPGRASWHCLGRVLNRRISNIRGTAMRTGKEFCGTQLIEVLNEDIECELRIADRHIARALLAARLGKYAVRRYSSVCAAAAMRRATALAAEVLHLACCPPRHRPAEYSCSKYPLSRPSCLVAPHPRP